MLLKTEKYRADNFYILIAQAEVLCYNGKFADNLREE